MSRIANGEYAMRDSDEAMSDIQSLQSYNMDGRSPSTPHPWVKQHDPRSILGRRIRSLVRERGTGVSGWAVGGAFGIVGEWRMRGPSSERGYAPRSLAIPVPLSGSV